MTMRAVELVIDWVEETVFWTFFEGEEEATEGVERFHKSEIGRNDFPEPRYGRAIVRNKEAADAMAERVVAALFNKVDEV